MNALLKFLTIDFYLKLLLMLLLLLLQSMENQDSTKRWKILYQELLTSLIINIWYSSLFLFSYGIDDAIVNIHVLKYNIFWSSWHSEVIWGDRKILNLNMDPIACTSSSLPQFLRWCSLHLEILLFSFPFISLHKKGFHYIST